MKICIFERLKKLKSIKIRLKYDFRPDVDLKLA